MKNQERFVGNHVGIPFHRRAGLPFVQCDHLMGEVLRVDERRALVRCERCQKEFLDPEDPGYEARVNHADRKRKFYRGFLKPVKENMGKEMCFWEVSHFFRRFSK